MSTNLSYNKVFIFFTFSCLFGIFCNNILRDFSLSMLFLCVSTLVLINFYSHVRRYLLFIFFIFLWWVWWIIISDRALDDVSQKNDFMSQFHDTQNHEVHLEIQKIYKKSDFDITYRSKVLQVWNVEPWKNIHALFKTKANFDLEIWEHIGFETPIIPNQNFDNSFDYVSFLETKNIYSTLYSHDFRNIWFTRLPFWREYIIELRQQILQKIHLMFPKNEAIFLWWILIWARESVPEKLETSFNNSGLTHLIAVSGYNITIIIVFLSSVLIFVPKFFRVVFITCAIIVYVYVVWDSPAVLRAALMWMVWYYVLMSGRQWDSLAIILFSALVMLCINPLLLSHDISFQLSFLAVFWLLYTQWFFEKIFFFLPKKFAIQESFVLTLSAFVFTIPIMLGNFWQISILAPIANMLVAWSIPFAMLFWVISLLLWIFFPYVAYGIGIWEYFLLKWTTTVATIFWGLDFAILEVEWGEYIRYYQVLYFMLIIFAILYFQKEEDV